MHTGRHGTMPESLAVPLPIRPSPQTDTQQTVLPPRSATFLPALAAAGLLWLCYFPLAWGWLAWVALVPLLALVYSTARPRRIFFAAWLGGLAFFVPVLQWMRVADERMVYTWLLLAFYCSLFFPVGVLLMRRVVARTRWPLVVVAPVVWTALEFFRGYVAGGFPWYFLGHTQHALLPLIQVADLAGAFAVSFVVVAGNAALFELLATRPWVRALLRIPEETTPRWGKALLLRSGAVVLLIGAVAGYGVLRLGQEKFTPGPRLALIQGNLDQRVRNEASTGAGQAVETMRDHYLRLCQQASAQEPRPDLIVWPETSFFDLWVERVPGGPVRQCLDTASALADYLKTNTLLGLNTVAVDGEAKEARYNSALLVQADGRVGGRYDKMHRVPFGEYVPLRESLPFMNALAPYDFDYSIRAGTEYTRFPLGRYHFGVLICYEDSDPSLARQYVRDDTGGPPVDFLVNISNDGWFNGTSEHEEHLAICRFRAVEARRGVVRAVNMGISAVLDGSGRVLAPRPVPGNSPSFRWEVDGNAPALPLAEWSSMKKVAGVVAGEVPLDNRTSLYARWGDWLPWSCWILLGVALFLPRPRAARW